MRAITFISALLIALAISGQDIINTDLPTSFMICGILLFIMDLVDWIKQNNSR